MSTQCKKAYVLSKEGCHFLGPDHACQVELYVITPTGFSKVAAILSFYIKSVDFSVLATF